MRKRKRQVSKRAVTADSKSSALVPALVAQSVIRGKCLPSPTPPFTSPDILLALVISLAIGAAYFPIMQGMTASDGDYSAHADFARRFREQGTLLSPACLLHILVAGIVQLGLAASYSSALLGVVVCSHAAVGGVLYLAARWAFSSSAGILGRLIPALIAVLVPFVQPPVDRAATYFIGFLWAEPYHSPTYTLSKPFALASAVFAAYFLVTASRPSWKAISLCAASVALGALAKPSFMICALPTVVLCAAYRHFRRGSFSKAGVLCGWLLPALAVLAWQYYRTYFVEGTQTQYGDSIIFAPLAVMRFHTNNLLMPYILSALLPLSVLLIYGRRAPDDNAFRFSVIAFLFGTIYSYTLAEKLRLAAGNFLWSGYITIFVLYYFSVVLVLKDITKVPLTVGTALRATPCLAILAWQLSSGFSVHMNFVGLYTFTQP